MSNGESTNKISESSASSHAKDGIIDFIAGSLGIYTNFL